MLNIVCYESEFHLVEKYQIKITTDDSDCKAENSNGKHFQNIGRTLTKFTVFAGKINAPPEPHEIPQLGCTYLCTVSWPQGI